MDDDVVVDDGTLRLLRPLDQVEHDCRRAVTRWLWDHGVSPATVAPEFPIRRDEFSNAVAWHERLEDGIVVRRWRIQVAAGWPAPFPRMLLLVATASDVDHRSGA